MKHEQENLKLKPGLRDAYRRAEVSEYLQTRVMASIEQASTPTRLYPLAAGALVSVLVLVMLFFNISQQQDTRQLGLATSGSSLISLSHFAEVHDAVNNINVPGLSSLQSLPALNQFKTPYSSQYSPGQICLYQPTGDRKC